MDAKDRNVFIPVGRLTYATLSPKAWITERLAADASIFRDTADCTASQDVFPIALLTFVTRQIMSARRT